MAISFLYAQFFKYHGPARSLRLFDNDLIPIANLLVQNQEIAKTNRSLLIENVTLQSLHTQSVCQWQQERKMLQGNWAATLVDAARIHNEKEEWKNRAEFYHSAFDAATKTIDDMRKSREEQFKHLRQDISIREWISQHDQQGTVPTEEFVEFLQSLG